MGLLPALLVESVFFLAIGFEETRRVFARIASRRTQSLIMISSGILPFGIATITAGTFDSHAFFILLGLSAVVSCWYWLLPHRVAYDIGFLIIVAAVLRLARLCLALCLSQCRAASRPIGSSDVDPLAFIALLIQRGWDPDPSRFWPTRQEWQVGLIQYSLLLIVAMLAGGRASAYVRAAAR